MSPTPRPRRPRLPALLAALALVVSTALAGCTGDTTDQPTPPQPSSLAPGGGPPAATTAALELKTWASAQASSGEMLAKAVYQVTVTGHTATITLAPGAEPPKDTTGKKPIAAFFLPALTDNDPDTATLRRLVTTISVGTADGRTLDTAKVGDTTNSAPPVTSGTTPASTTAPR